MKQQELSLRRRRRQAGVTLIEMLVVVTIIALFASIVGPRLFKAGDSARVTAARTQINGFMQALVLYKNSTGVFPTAEQGLAALRVKPAEALNWDGPYLQSNVPADPWGRPYLYRYPSPAGDEPEIISLGADGQPGGEGINADISSAGTAVAPAAAQ
ncbi:MAG: type II secretion system major pseudopilin GspG [Bryobacter sp.]|nr:type II secretion system major pseudopilin GspG [Bryobacter sp.]